MRVEGSRKKVHLRVYVQSMYSVPKLASFLDSYTPSDEIWEQG